LGQRAITEFNYRYADETDAHIFVGVQMASGQKNKGELVALLESR
ncbi:MAG: hypothetical protein GWN77_00665, partial [Gammaproteobacteria bacterium]|nr:hypothetical protein [Gammaproteobacteria bacterium]